MMSFDGVYFFEKSSVYIENSVEFGKNITIEPNVFIGHGVKISDNCIIKAFSYLEGVEILENCIIGPFARIRPKSKIGPNCKIGNFVEIKNSTITKSKVGHLSYIGDAELEEDVNIGAGCVTCNYSGSSKHKTKFSRGAFIGSNSCFIAPVQIGAESVVGAGSVITKDVAPKNLAIARSRQKNLNKDFRKRK